MWCCCCQGYSASDERKQDQKDIDQSVLGAVAKSTELKGVLEGTIYITKGQYPHKMVFWAHENFIII